jgi:hypothetical protein
MVSIVQPNGEIKRAPPGAFGAITNAHHMKLNGPWDSTFEPIFNRPDGEMADFVSWLFTLEASACDSNLPMLKRIQAQPLPPDRQLQISRIVASILARSPRIRYVIKIGTEYYREKFGLADTRADKNLIAGNQRGLYDAYRRRMESSGRWAVLFSDSKELVAGDGFFHNFPASADAISSGKKLVLPILPTVAVVFMAPSSHPTEPKLVTLRLGDIEAEQLNEIVQVYSRDILYFRTKKPALIEAFKAAEYREFQYNQHDWLDSLLDDLSQYNLWGKNGAPSMGKERPYSESIAGARMLDRLIDQKDY